MSRDRSGRRFKASMNAIVDAPRKLPTSTILPFLGEVSGQIVEGVNVAQVGVPRWVLARNEREFIKSEIEGRWLFYDTVLMSLPFLYRLVQGLAGELQVFLEPFRVDDLSKEPPRMADFSGQGISDGNGVLFEEYERLRTHPVTPPHRLLIPFEIVFLRH